MLNDRAIRGAFLISFMGHCLLLSMPGFSLSLNCEIKEPEEITINIEIEKPLLVPKIDIMGEKKKFKEIVEDLSPPEQEQKRESRTDPQPELLPEEIVMEQYPDEPIKKPIEEKIEIIKPDQEAMLRYQDMIKQRIQEARRYPFRARKQGIEGIVNISFNVLSDGLSRNIQIIRSSGYKILDEEAVKTIKRANPFPPIPKEFYQDLISMQVNIVFKIK
ncbi:MAG: TonB family protein [Candidatus Omnitrophica bacterium]|nr:TonB family protein [Candidatus Omnitrophota bacterium]